MTTLKNIFKHKVLLLFLFLLCSNHLLYSQRNSLIRGDVKTEDGKNLDLVNVSLKGSAGGSVTNDKGVFLFKLTKSFPVTLVFTRIGYYTREVDLDSVPDLLHVVMSEKKESIDQVEIKAHKRDEGNLTRIDAGLSAELPDATGGSIESLVKTQMGVSSNNELSSQYRVRGGNFDENMVYVNDIEVYRPQLVRSGQQEGLSFVNPEMVSEVQFSAGGFDARYGDKMSSVLDIHYKRPSEFGGNVSGSLLGGAVHLEGVSKNSKFTHITGVRYKTSRYLLGSLDESGDYEPNFFDAQTYLTYRLNKKWSVGFLGNVSKNSYDFKPEDRETTFGTLSDVKKLKIYFEGQEEDEFLTGFGAVTLNFSPDNNQLYKIIASGYRTSEDESYDILGEYWLQETGEYDEDGNVVYDESEDIGVGSYLEHARNYLFGAISNIALRGNYFYDNSRLEWEVKYQHERFSDMINEWELIDSAGYTTTATEDALTLYNVSNADNDIRSNRISAFIQNNRNFTLEQGALRMDFGIRFNYWDFNNEFLVSPRVSLYYDPNWEKDVVFRFATGVYYQSPFYKEYRSEDGEINDDIKSQRAIHFVAGLDYYFNTWGNKPFKFSSEIYYKLLSNLNPYTVDNVRIRYSAENNAKGYAAGIDFKLNGEFVEGVESWASLSLMKTMEDLEDDSYTDDDGAIHYPGYIPRPSDQRVNFSLMIQDYLRNNPSFKFHLNFMYGSGLPFGPPDSERYLATSRMPAYRRIDIGFSKEITGAQLGKDKGSAFKNIWIGLEVFNLFNIDNTISYFWVSDVNNRQYAVPNYLTSRRVNLKLNVKF